LAKKLFYFAKLNQHAYYDFEGLKWTSFKVFDRRSVRVNFLFNSDIGEGKIVVIDKQNILIIGG